MSKKPKTKAKAKPRVTPANLREIGFEFCADMIDPTTGRRGKYVHVEGDDVGEQLLRDLDAGRVTVEAAIERARARRLRAAQIEHAALHPASGDILDHLNRRGRTTV